MSFKIFNRKIGLKLLIRCPRIFDKYLGHLLDTNGEYFKNDYNGYTKKQILIDCVNAKMEIDPIKTDLTYGLNQIQDPTKNIHDISELDKILKVSIQSDCGDCIHRFNFEIIGSCEETYTPQIR